MNTRIGGHWTGAKLRCQKEVGKLVRCGTPAAFEITFADDGTGSTPDENLPQEFTWRWNAANEIGMKPKAGGEETKLFSVEHQDETILTFQAYIYLPTAYWSAGRGALHSLRLRRQSRRVGAVAVESTAGVGAAGVGPATRRIALVQNARGR